MQDLSITQEYYICAVNEKGRISDFSTERLVCFVAAGLLDLQLEGCLSLDKKNVTVTGPLPAGRAYLKPLYEFLAEKGTMKPEKVMEAYTYSLSDKHIDALMGSVGTSLEEMGLAQAVKAGSSAARPPSPPVRRPSTGWWIWCAPSCWRTARSPMRWPPSPPCWTKAAA